ncbi:unnamed protein product, partial [Anisakis simplex]|uniref:Acyl-coenzyme A thioesterase 8 (inferred by orthology to a human protein) n=1 Tax=Anisakis simplex TaxID=6269 RepID=A0A0M3KC62_ANISI
MERIGDNVFRSTYLRSGSPRSPAVYGGLLFAQALAAAEETVSERLRVHSIHSMFILAAGISKPIDYFVKTLRDGRSFCTRWVEAKQRGHIVFTCQISFHSPEEAAMKHQAKMPEVAPPEHCPELYDGAEQLLEQAAQGHYQINPVREERLRQRIKDKFKVGAPLFEMRPTDLEEFLALKMSPEPNKSFVWVK